MSYIDAVSQIEQIRAMQQQLLDPATVAAASTDGTTDPIEAAETASTGGASLVGSSSSSGSSGTTATEFAAALLAAEGQTGTASAATLLGTGGTAATGTSETGTSATAAEQVQAMTAKANSLVGDPYVWGGGHSGWGAQSGYDCSGFVSAVLHAGGYLSTPQDTATLPDAAGIESGPGQYVTIYDRDGTGEEGHVIIDIDGQFYESGGEAGSWGGGGGVEKIGTPTAAYLATFDRILHPAGL